jgi:hypothetical protein
MNEVLDCKGIATREDAGGKNRLAMWFGFPQEERTIAAFNPLN